MKYSSMETPKTREEFEARCFHLLNAIKLGRYHGIPGEGNKEQVPFLPNGRVDLANIDTMTRLSMNSLYDFHYNRDNYPQFDFSENDDDEEVTD
jgi:hypothetical protein